MSIEAKVKNILQSQMKEVVSEGQRVMKAFAPQPRRTDKGLGSYATGATRSDIHTEWHGDKEAFVGVQNDHAHYADQGRGAIHSDKAMVWYDKRGRKHVAHDVSAMQGWHFVEKTAKYIRARYGK